MLRPIPVLPVASARGWRGSQQDRAFRNVVAGHRVLSVSSGAAAIAIALEASGIGDGDEVLVPAFNCRAMREPAWLHGATDVLYRLRADLSIDLEDIAGRITAATRAVIAAHYFGFPQDLAPIRTLCDEHGIVLIEDCAHALLRRYEDTCVGSYGHYVVGSATKFFPVPDGGFLAVCEQRVVPAIDAESAKLDLKSAWNAVEIAVRHGRLPTVGPLLRPVYAMRRMARRKPAGAGRVGAAGSKSLKYLARTGYRRPMSRISRMIVSRYSLDQAAARRRANYRRLAATCKQLAHAKLLFPTLDDATVPYMLPIVIDGHETRFARLKDRGMPMYRWEDSGESDCTVSTEYSQSLIQVPCHEQLHEAEIERIEEMLRQCLWSACACPERRRRPTERGDSPRPV